MSESRTRLVLIALAVALAIPLVLHGVIGTYARYSTDDYCFAILPAQHDYRYVEYLMRVHRDIHGRFSASALLFFMDRLDPRQTPAYPMLLIGGMVASMAAAFYVLMRRLRLRHALIAAIILAEAAVVVMLQILIKGDAAIGQTLYWRSASLVYTPPKILLPLLITLIITGRRQWAVIGAVGVIALIAAGFSETYGVMIIALTGAIMPLLWLVLDADQRRRVMPMLVAVLIGSFAAMVIMFNSVTVQSGHLPRLPLIRIAAEVIQTGFWMGEQGFKASPFAILLMVALPAALIRALRRADSLRLSASQQALITTGLPAALMIAVLISLMPGVMSGRGVPARALTLPYYLIVVGGMMWSLLALPSLRFDFEQRYPQFGRVVRLGALALIIAVVVGREIREAPERIALAQSQAAAWDAQDAAILAAKAGGKRNVVVQRIEPMWVTETIGPNPNWYLNLCAADYYGVEALSTDD